MAGKEKRINLIVGLLFPFILVLVGADLAVPGLMEGWLVLIVMG